jgi:hypothetical protein
VEHPIYAIFESLDSKVSLRKIESIETTYYVDTCEHDSRVILKRRIFDLAYGTLDSSPVYIERK